MSLVCKYKARIQNLEKCEHLYHLLSKNISSKVEIGSRESNLLKSLERAISLQREDADRLQKKLSITSKLWIKFLTSHVHGQASRGMKRLDKGEEWRNETASTAPFLRRFNTTFLDIIKSNDELNFNRFKISMTIACSFIAVDLLVISVGYAALYGWSIPALTDSRQTISLLIISAIVTSTLMCIGIMYSVMKQRK